MELARELHAAGVPIVLLSNEPREPSFGADTGLPRVDRVVRSGCLFRRGGAWLVPDPAIFDLALDRMRAVVGGDLQAADVLFTDDSLVNIERRPVSSGFWDSFV